MLADLLECMKKAALEVVKDGKPMAIVFGRVVAVNPVEIQISQKLILKESLNQIVFTRNVTDYQLSVSPVGWGTNVAYVNVDGYSESHSHTVNGSKLNVYNALKVGESVILLRQEGGQQYVVLDRMVS